MKDLLDIYYKGFAAKSGWESVIADDFSYTGGDLTKSTPAKGKAAYVEVIRRFSQIYTSMRVKEMIIDGQKACVLGNYDFSFPNGTEVNGDVAELWTAKNNKLQSLRIFFDTKTFAENSTPK